MKFYPKRFVVFASIAVLLGLVSGLVGYWTGMPFWLQMFINVFVGWHLGAYLQVKLGKFIEPVEEQK